MAQADAFIASSLQRIFPDWQPILNSIPMTVLRQDTISFQVAVHWNGAFNTWANVRVEAPGPLTPRLRAVALVPSAYPAPGTADGGYERVKPGLFPDRLAELDDGRFRMVTGQYRALWVDIEIDNNIPAAVYPVRIIGEDEAGSPLFTVETTVEVLPVGLPKQQVYHTEWLHADCLADYYGVQVFSDRHFEIIERFIQTAVRRGMNTLLTPLFTYPLDTSEGGERTTVQLIGVQKTGGSYQFDFTLFERWVAMCEKLGVCYYEMSHLFSQWGAKYAPRIIADVDGVNKKLFGWHTPGGGQEYKAFLSAFLPALNNELLKLGIAERCFFHVSDEPEKNDLPAYMAAKNFVSALLPGYKIVDALSDYSFYREGASEHPIPAIDKIEPFIEGGAEELWTYYCVAQGNKVSNRFFSMPLSRVRILGVQLYKYNISGFLHWGFNFYNSQFSVKHINPYDVTDAGEAFPSGDPFIVYPGADGYPEESLRLMAMDAAFKDLRALQLLESLIGRADTVKLVDGILDSPTLTSYPYEDAPLLKLRTKVNELIASYKF